MQTPSPHFLLFSQASAEAPGHDQWRFELQPVGGSGGLVAADVEPGARRTRLELLAVVRGLEALDQPSRVTLLAQSRYVRRGIQRGLSQWRERHWRWERFGRLVPMRDDDLWRRVDRALEFHDVECCAKPSAAARSAMRSAASNRDDAEADVRQNEPAVLIVPRRRRNRWEPRRAGGIARRLSQLVSAWWSDYRGGWKPAFTRAA